MIYVLYVIHIERELISNDAVVTDYLATLKQRESTFFAAPKAYLLRSSDAMRV